MNKVVTNVGFTINDMPDTSMTFLDDTVLDD